VGDGRFWRSCWRRSWPARGTVTTQRHTRLELRTSNGQLAATHASQPRVRIHLRLQLRLRCTGETRLTWWQRVPFPVGRTPGTAEHNRTANVGESHPPNHPAHNHSETPRASAAAATRPDGPAAWPATGPATGPTTGPAAASTGARRGSAGTVFGCRRRLPVWRPGRCWPVVWQRSTADGQHRGIPAARKYGWGDWAGPSSRADTECDCVWRQHKHKCIPRPGADTQQSLKSDRKPTRSIGQSDSGRKRVVQRRWVPEPSLD
jgi:hypothetical protein